MFRILRAISAHLAALASSLDPDTLTVEEAADAISRLASIEKQAAGMRIVLARRIDSEGFWREAGERSGAQWMAKQTGQSSWDAERDLECSKRLAGLDDTAKAVRKGELSANQARQVADAATADPSAEHELLETARKASFNELARAAKARKAAALGDDAARNRAAFKRRSLEQGTNSFGEHWGRYNGTAGDGARFRAWLKPFADREFERDRKTGQRRTPGARMYDALAAALAAANGIPDWIAERDGATNAGRATEPATAPSRAAAAGGCTAASNSSDSTVSEAPTTPTPRSAGFATEPPSTLPADGAASTTPLGTSANSEGPVRPSTRSSMLTPTDDSTTDATTPIHRSTSPPGAPPPYPMPTPAVPPRAGRTNAKVIIRVDAPALRRGHTLPGETCDIAGYGPITIADLQEFLPDAAIEIVITNGRDAFNVTSLTRHTTAHQQTVLDLLNIGCTRECCDGIGRLQIDHRVDWHKIHVTELRNLDWLCPHCHDLKTTKGWLLEPGTGKRRMLPPDQQWWRHGGDPPPGSDRATRSERGPGAAPNDLPEAQLPFAEPALAHS